MAAWVVGLRQTNQARQIMSLRAVCGNWHYRFQVDHRVYTANTGLPATERSRKKAEQIEAKARVLVLEGRGWELKIRTIPFHDAARHYLEFVDGEAESPATARRIRASFASLVKFFGSKPVAVITPGDIEDYKQWRRSNSCRDITIRHDLHALSPFFRWARRHRYARVNPVEEVEIPGTKGANRTRVLTPEEELEYFSACIRLGYLDLSDAAKLILLQGCRPNEVLRAHKSDVDLERRTWRVGSKTEAGERTLDLLDEARAILMRRMGGESSWLFPSPRKPGQPIVSLQRQHEAVLAAAGLSFVLYDLRHTMASRAAETVDVATLARILGHANPSVTLRYYVHVSDEHKRAATAKIEAANVARLAALMERIEAEQVQQEQRIEPIN